MTETFIAVILTSLAACGFTSLGIFVISRYGGWAHENAIYFQGFAAGILVTISLTHLVPEAFELNRGRPWMLLAGFLLFYLSDHVLDIFLGHQGHDKDRLRSAIVPTLAIGFHSLLDGVLYTVTFNISIFTGVLAATGMLLHEFPEGIITYVLLSRGGLSRRQSTGYAFLAAGLTTPFGTLASFPFISAIAPPALGGWLSFTAGAILYVGASHLLPEVEHARNRYSVLAMAAGVVVAVVVVLLRG